MNSSDDSTMADVELVMNLMGCRDDFKYARYRYTNKKTGGTITFKGIRATGSQTAKLKSLSGVTTVIFEEAEEIESFEEFSKIDEGIRVEGKPLKIILVYNPGSAIKSWIHKEWFINGQPNPDRFHDTCFLHSTYKDNLKNLAKSTIKRYEDLRLTNPTYYTQVILAEWTLDVINKVYEGWGEYPRFEDVGEIWYGLDFGYGGTDSTSLIEVNYFEEVYYLREIFSIAKLGIKETVWEMRKKGVSTNALIIADPAVPEFIKQIKSSGYSQIKKAKKGPNSKEQGIKKVQDLPIVMVGDSPHLYYSYMTFNRGKDGKLPHEPDPLAATRYALAYKNPVASVVKQSHGYI
jgi:phage terminase large subunit